MKKWMIPISKFVMAIGLLLTAVSCTKDDTSGLAANENGNINTANLQTQLNALPKESLSDAETASLLFMREEEKLARDVYITLNNQWHVNVFANISRSEQTHMDAVLMLLQKYELDDPVGANPAGVFSNNHFQQLYDQLIGKGSTRVSEAYITGATIEDLDLLDLQQAMGEADNQDILLVYGMLTKGSRNHLRAFYRNVLKTGGSYTPQYITQILFDDIINSPMETGY